MAKSRNATNHKTPKKRSNKSESDSSPEKKPCPDTPSREAAKCFSTLRISTPSRNTRSQSNLTTTTIGDIVKKPPATKQKRQLFTSNKDNTRTPSKSPARASTRLRKDASPPHCFTVCSEDDEMDIDNNCNIENISPSVSSIAPLWGETSSKSAYEFYKVEPIILKKVKHIVDINAEEKIIYRVSHTPRAVAKPSKRITLEDLRSVLHTSEIPENMPCREEEFETIRKFVIEGVKKKSTSQAMYISGVPGTGKTATTQAVIKYVKKSNKFKYVAVNAMELMEPKQIFVEIYKGILDSTKRISAVNARKKLNMMFERADKNRPPVVILIDELDMLCTKRQEIFYDVFNWTSIEDARVSVIAIANTLDLPERVMNQKITSRLGTNRVVFQPYSYPQIEEIVQFRVSHASHLVHEQAIEFVSKKVANVSGDLRKAMDLLRRAIEIAVEQGEKSMLRFEHVNMAQKESASAPRNVIGENLSRHEFILFRAALCKVQSSGVEEILFSDLYKQYHVLCTSLEGVNPLHDYAAHHLLMQLCSNRFLVASPGMNYPRRKIRLGMPMHDAQFIIKQVEDARKEGRITWI